MLTRKHRHFTFLLIVLCLLYLGFAFFINAYTMLPVDDFWFSHRIYQFKTELPYRDFAPYKTVLGYYVLLIPMLLSHGLFNTLIATKHFIALINASVILIAALWLERYFTRKSILISLSLVLFSDIFLFYSTNIRVDLIGYWLGFFSLLFLLENRLIFAGILLGFAFAATQKVIWYLFASNCALGAMWYASTHKWQDMRQILKFNASVASVIFAYLIVWARVSDWPTVINSVFHEASIMYHLEWYDSARLLFWSAITNYNPFLFLAWPLTVFSLFAEDSNDTTNKQRLFVVVYSMAILFCLIPYKQVFPYYMQVTYPVFLSVYAAFFTWFFKIIQQPNQFRLRLSKKLIWALVFLYLITLITLSTFFSLPSIYLIISIVPILLGLYLTHPHLITQDIKYIFSSLLFVTIVFIGFIYPGILIFTKTIQLDGRYQKANVRAVSDLLQDGSDYVAGIELIYNKTQPISGMRHLMGPAISFLESPTEALRQVMLASLYEDSNATCGTVIQALTDSKVKFYVNNYRMEALPYTIKRYLDSQYMHWRGSIYLYAPKVFAGNQTIHLKFPGLYQIQSSNNIRLNHQLYPPTHRLYLQAGTYLSQSPKAYRLKYLPRRDKVFHPDFYKDQWEKMIY